MVVMSFDIKLNIWKLPNTPPGLEADCCKPCDTWVFELLCAESNTHTPMNVSKQAMMSIDKYIEIEIDTLACPGMCTGIPRPTTASSDAEKKEF